MPDPQPPRRLITCEKCRFSGQTYWTRCCEMGNLSDKYLGVETGGGDLASAHRDSVTTVWVSGSESQQCLQLGSRRLYGMQL